MKYTLYYLFGLKLNFSGSINGNGKMYQDIAGLGFH